MSTGRIMGFWFALLIVRPACFAADLARFIQDHRAAQRKAKENRKKAGLVL